MLVEDNLVPGSHLGDAEGDAVCYEPVFMSDNDSKTWFFGNMFMNEYYTVFDMTPFSEKNQNYLQIGFGKQNKKDLIFAEGGGDKYDEKFGPDEEDEEEESGGGGAGTFFLVVFLLALFGSIGWYMVKGFQCFRNGETGFEFIQKLKGNNGEAEDYDQLDADEVVEKGKKNSALEALENIQKVQNDSSADQASERVDITQQSMSMLDADDKGDKADIKDDGDKVEKIDGAVGE